MARASLLTCAMSASMRPRRAFMAGARCTPLLSSLASCSLASSCLIRSISPFTFSTSAKNRSMRWSPGPMSAICVLGPPLSRSSYPRPFFRAENVCDSKSFIFTPLDPNPPPQNLNLPIPTKTHQKLRKPKTRNACPSFAPPPDPTSPQSAPAAPLPYTTHSPALRCSAAAADLHMGPLTAQRPCSPQHRRRPRPDLLQTNTLAGLRRFHSSIFVDSSPTLQAGGDENADDATT